LPSAPHNIVQVSLPFGGDNLSSSVADNEQFFIGDSGDISSGKKLGKNPPSSMSVLARIDSVCMPSDKANVSLAIG